MSPQCPEEKRKIYGTLALKQLERAAELASSVGSDRGSAPAAADRDLRSEEEVTLFYRMLAKNGNPDNFLAKTRDSTLVAIKQLTEGGGGRGGRARAGGGARGRGEARDD